MDDASGDNPSPLSSRRFLSLTIAKIPIAELDTAVQKVLSRIAEGGFRRVNGSLDLASTYKIEPPAGGEHLFKLLLYSPESSPTSSVIISNVADGWNALSNLVQKEHQSYQLQILSTQMGVPFPQNRLEVWKFGKTKRVVMAMKDSDDWIFVEKGEPEPFEDIKLYRQKTKSKLFDRLTILNYMRIAGYDLENISFWRSPRNAIYYQEGSKIKPPTSV